MDGSVDHHQESSTWNHFCQETSTPYRLTKKSAVDHRHITSWMDQWIIIRNHQPGTTFVRRCPHLRKYQDQWIIVKDSIPLQFDQEVNTGDVHTSGSIRISGSSPRIASHYNLTRKSTQEMSTPREVSGSVDHRQG